VRITYLDLGGQRIERSHWKDVKEPWGVVFVVGIDCYNQTDSDFGLDHMGEKTATTEKRISVSGRVNMLKDSLDVFHSVAKQCEESKIPLILLMNKVDLFERNVSKGDMGQYLVGYEGGDDLQKAKAYMKQLFIEQVPKALADKNNFYSHFIKLVDGNAAEKILQSVQKIIIERNMATSFKED
jgi:hypothetical protein